MKRGFTVVELLITLVVIGILLGLGTVGLRSTLANGRDAERQADIETIARGLEEYYKRGNPYYIPGNTKGSYPGSNMLVSIDGGGWCTGTVLVNSAQAANYSTCRPGTGYWSEVLPGVTEAAVTPPGFTSAQTKQPWNSAEANPVAVINPTITSFLNEGKYVYKALNDDNSNCYSDNSCQRFALLYKKETTGEIIIKYSKHQ